MEDQTKSDMEIALEFVNTHSSLVDNLDGIAFQSFWDHPTKVIPLFEMSVQTLKNAPMVTDEIINEMAHDLLKDACDAYLNLNTNEP